MIIVCCYCKRIIGTKAPTEAGITHGICKRCKKRAEKKLERDLCMLRRQK